MAKNGLPAKSARIRTLLQQKLSNPRTSEALVARWLRLAMRGSWPHLQGILDRLDPLDDHGAGGRVVLEGLKLELTDRGASLTMVKGEPKSLPQADLASRRDELGTPGGGEPTMEASDSEAQVEAEGVPREVEEGPQE